MINIVFGRRLAVGALGVTAVFALHGCAQNTLSRHDEGVAQGGFNCKLMSTCVSVLRPPIVIEAARLRTVAVVPGQARGSEALATQFESRLSKVRVNDQLYYNVVMANDPKRDAVYEITMTGLTNTEGKVQETRDCVSKGFLSIKTNCGAKAKHEVECTVRKGVASATLRLRKPDGAVLAVRQESTTAESKKCAEDKNTKFLEPVELLTQATDALSAKLQDLVAMSAELQPVRAMEDVSQIKDAGRRLRFTNATVFLKAGRLDRSCGVYEELIEIERSSVALYYNTAFCVQAKGDWSRANQLCRQADALTTAPSKEVQQCIQDTQLSAIQSPG